MRDIMPRTQLHSAASGLARTRFHANRGVRVEELKVELAQANVVVTTKIEDAKDEIKADTATLKTGTSDLLKDTGILKTDTTILKRRTRPTPAIGRPELTPEQQTQVFECMRILHQVESLTTDERQNVTQKNRALGRIRNDTSLQSSLNTLPEVLQERARVVQNDFPSAPDDEARERLERFWEIQDLRQDIIAHFAAQQLVAPGSTPPADAPATQDTQS
jgi:hypothetical protein